MNGGAVSRFRRANEKRVLEGPPVHEQLGAPAGGLSIAWSLNESIHPERTRCVADRDQSPCQVPAPHRSQTLCRILIRRHCQPAGTIDMKLKTGIRVGQGECSNCFVGGSGFAGDGAKEFPAGGSIKEQSANLNRGSPLTRQ